jgi:hypothetical protein
VRLDSLKVVLGYTFPGASLEPRKRWLCYRDLPVFVLPRLVISVERHTEAEPQLALCNLGGSLRTIRITASGGASRGHVDLVAGQISEEFQTVERVVLPRSICDLPAIALRDFGELRADALEQFIDNVAILKSQTHLLLRL